MTPRLLERVSTNCALPNDWLRRCRPHAHLHSHKSLIQSSRLRSFKKILYLLLNKNETMFIVFCGSSINLPNRGTRLTDYAGFFNRSTRESKTPLIVLELQRERLAEHRYSGARIVQESRPLPCYTKQIR